MEDTITAIATPHGVGAISIVRISGKNALEIASKITKKDKNSFKERVMYLTNFYNNQNKIIDKGLIVYFKAPASFTGEDIIEFQTHGGVLIGKLLLETIISFGGRVAKGGEFTKRAFLNGKIDLTEAEAIGELINAKSEEAVLQLSRQLNGELKYFVDRVRDSLINILAHSEVTIDYAEEDLPQNLLDSIKNNLQNIEKELLTILNSSKRRTTIFEGFKIAIIGRPNVGKSALLNSLLNYNRAIVSSIAGTTRDSIEELLTIGSHLVKIIDTAGIRKSNNEIEKIGIERSLKAIENADIILSVFDSSTKLETEDKEIIKLLTETNKKVFILLNKNDLEQNIEKDIFKNFEVISISAKKDNSKLLNNLENYLNLINKSGDNGIILSSVRQIDYVQKAYNSIVSANLPLLSGELELFSFHINEAIEYISEISKPYQYSEMLDSMFGDFCLGK